MFVFAGNCAHSNAFCLVVFSYIPEYTNDPFTEDGCVWAFNYLFWNRNLKRILFLCCRALHEINLDMSAATDQLWLDEN